MDNPVLISAIEKLQKLGNQAGFTTEELISVLNGGFTVEELLDLIQYRLEKQKKAV